MNTERLFSVVMMELTTEKMKLEDDLESAINSKESIENKVSTIKHLLNRISIMEATIAKFSNLINNNNKNEN
jgi:hypothetical protein